MNKKYKFLLIIGFTLILTGTFILLTKDKMKIDKNFKYEVSFIENFGEEITSCEYQYYEINNLNYSYLNDYNIKTKNKLNFGYPEEVIYIGDSFFGREFESSNLNIHAGYFNPPFSLDKLLENVKEEYEKEGYTKINYSLGNPINIDGYKVDYIKFNAIEESREASNKKYKEEFYLYIELNNNVITIRYELTNYKFRIDTLNKIINSISIEENKASYLVSKIEKDKIKGTLTAIDSKDNVYNLDYEFSTDKCYEIESISNGTSSVSFSTSDKKIIFNIRMLNILYDKSKYKDLSTYYKEYLTNLYEKDKNIENYSMKDYIANDKKYLKITFIKNIENKKIENLSLIEFVDDEVIVVYEFESDNKIIESNIIYFVDCDIK